MSKRGENITKRKDGRWEARYIKYYKKGKAVYGYLYGKTYSEAKKKKENALRDNTEVSTQKSAELFNDLINYFLLQKKYCVKESTYAHYCNLVDRHIRNELGSVQLITNREAQLSKEDKRIPHFVILVMDESLVEDAPFRKHMVDAENKIGVSTIFFGKRFNSIPKECAAIIQKDKDVCGIYIKNENNKHNG